MPFVECLNQINRGMFFLAITVFFVLVGIAFGIASAIILAMTLDRVDDELILIAMFAPPGVGTVVGIIIGTIAAAFHKVADKDDVSLPAKPPFKD